MAAQRSNSESSGIESWCRDRIQNIVIAGLAHSPCTIASDLGHGFICVNGAQAADGHDMKRRWAGTTSR
jgi:hypothetical protein